MHSMIALHFRDSSTDILRRTSNKTSDKTLVTSAVAPFASLLSGK